MEYIFSVLLASNLLSRSFYALHCIGRVRPDACSRKTCQRELEPQCVFQHGADCRNGRPVEVISDSAGVRLEEVCRDQLRRNALASAEHEEAPLLALRRYLARTALRIHELFFAQRGFLARNGDREPTAVSQPSLRVADHTDEGSGSDSQKPVVNDNVLYHSVD